MMLSNTMVLLHIYTILVHVLWFKRTLQSCQYTVISIHIAIVCLNTFACFVSPLTYR